MEDDPSETCPVIPLSVSFEVECKLELLLPYLVGGMCEWLKQAVLKTAVRETVPGVRIPLPPPSNWYKST